MPADLPERAAFKDRTLLFFSVFATVLYAVGIAKYLHSPNDPLLSATTPWFLLVTGLPAFIISIPSERGVLYLAWGVVSCIFTLAVEIAGVKTGALFGSYEYGKTLGPHILGVPPVIGFNWVIIVLGFSGVCSRLPCGAACKAFLSAASATGFDWVMEPVAIALGYWKWEQNCIPLQNYAAWFFVSLLMSAAYVHLRVTWRNPAPFIIVFAQLVFFAVLRVSLGLSAC